MEEFFYCPDFGSGEVRPYFRGQSTAFGAVTTRPFGQGIYITQFFMED